MKRLCIRTFFFLAAVLITQTVFAKSSPKIAQSMAAYYPPAEMHEGLTSAYVPVDMSKLRGFVVVLADKIPAERARYFAGWDDYDYRGAVVHLDRGEKVTTRPGPQPYTHLTKGDVMAVAGVTISGSTIYLKLISPEIYVPEDKTDEKRFSRVTVMLGFKFPREVIKGDDETEVMEKIGEWLKPFPRIEDARVYQETLASEIGVASRANRLRELEQRLEDARRQIKQAEDEMINFKKGKEGK